MKSGASLFSSNSVRPKPRRPDPATPPQAPAQGNERVSPGRPPPEHSQQHLANSPKAEATKRPSTGEQMSKMRPSHVTDVARPQRGRVGTQGSGGQAGRRALGMTARSSRGWGCPLGVCPGAHQRERFKTVNFMVSKLDLNPFLKVARFAFPVRPALPAQSQQLPPGLDDTLGKTVFSVSDTVPSLPQREIFVPQKNLYRVFGENQRLRHRSRNTSPVPPS